MNPASSSGPRPTPVTTETQFGGEPSLTVAAKARKLRSRAFSSPRRLLNTEVSRVCYTNHDRNIELVHRKEGSARHRIRAHDTARRGRRSHGRVHRGRSPSHPPRR